MGCPHCGCRLVSRQPASRSEVICSDCAHPMTAHLRSQRPRRQWGDLGALALMLAMGFSALGLTTVKTVIISHKDGGPAAVEQPHSGEHQANP